ncbi:MAG: hypothetical protein A2534_01160 [Candidatus Magasanikbacteria bacterium RIFOXYD2_FULL_39_9]|uniref:AtpZ/AtpI family protein n=1 Tax=Candidatus Magasanikbacteria bacterium RIFOXYD1_FULL_40_23 TaxID=1798705 RepID=A0A1F6PAS3_9BACT|nr:MAG: hypothetical protein A2534_01160 [Candidatus Magasanikbacteria bacterium RIFOXYD2_FULL_39_9]OGH93285.1 MAG: hypothetical protein A2563_01620 [Candidatus Magasanikbacteria bacterium RIFOXYD1_FULL_40_23]
MEPQNPQKSSGRDYQILAFKIIGSFGASIAVPVVGFVLIGQYFDKKYSLSPLFTILAFVLAAAISAKIIHKQAKSFGAEYKRLNDAGKIIK